MALPKHKTTLSVLRSILGPGAGNEARFAEKIGRTRSYVKKLSSGEKPISKEIAKVIAYETGVCPRWLFANKPKAAPVDKWGKPYTEETYARYRNDDRERVNFDDFLKAEDDFCECILDAMSIFSHAGAFNRAGYFTFLFEEFIRDAKKRFPCTEIKGWPRAAEYALEVARYIMGCEKSITPRMFQEACKAHARDPQKDWRAERVSKAMQEDFRRVRNARARAAKPKNGGQPEGLKKKRKASVKPAAKPKPASKAARRSKPKPPAKPQSKRPRKK
jgi:hypothetical protein